MVLGTLEEERILRARGGRVHDLTSTVLQLGYVTSAGPRRCLQQRYSSVGVSSDCYGIKLRPSTQSSRAGFHYGVLHRRAYIARYIIVLVHVDLMFTCFDSTNEVVVKLTM